MDREKVIKAIDICLGHGKCDDCGYRIKGGYSTMDCRKPMMRDALTLLKEQEAVVRCKDCKHGSLYCTEDVCGETLIECNRPDIGDVIEIHGWKWFCADGERRTDDA